MAIADFGHHAKGVDLGEFEMPAAAGEYHPKGFYDVLFFYRPVRMLSRTTLTRMAKESADAVLKEQKARQDADMRERTERIKAEIAELVAILKGPTR
jgi:hypothetical protein